MRSELYMFLPGRYPPTHVASSRDHMMSATCIQMLGFVVSKIHDRIGIPMSQWLARSSRHSGGDIAVALRLLVVGLGFSQSYFFVAPPEGRQFQFGNEPREPRTARG